MSNVFDKSWEPAVIVALSLSVTVSVSMTVSLSVRECETYGLTLWCRRIDPMASHYDASGPIRGLHNMKPTDRSGGFYTESSKSHGSKVTVYRWKCQCCSRGLSKWLGFFPAPSNPTKKWTKSIIWSKLISIDIN